MAVSSLKCNTGLQIHNFSGEYLSRSFKSKTFSGPVVEFSGNGAQCALLFAPYAVANNSKGRECGPSSLQLPASGGWGEVFLFQSTPGAKINAPDRIQFQFESHQANL